MYKRYKQGIHEVEGVVERSLSNLSVVDLKQSSPSVTDEDNQSPQGTSGTPTYDPDVVNTVQECWEQIGSQCISAGSQAKDRCTEEDSGWKTVRVFVSSTFTDFFCEREVLVKKVFPELREWCRERMLYLVECDMRWGVPKDTVTADTIAICLEELDRCMEETGRKPFFLNMTGERYGWIPAFDEIPQEMREKFGWVPNTSITFMEILHGAYRMQNPNALFMFRDSSIIKDIPGHHLSRFQDSDPLQTLHLQKMKSCLKTRFADQVHDYKCSVDGLIQKNGKEMVNISNLDDFCSEVLEFFKTAIQRTYPDHKEFQPLESKVLEENVNQRKFVEEVAGTMCGREAELQLVMDYVTGDCSRLNDGELGKPFSRDTKFWKNFLSLENQLLFVSGQPGHGKTTLLAYVAQQALKAEGSMVFYHFCGSTGESQNDFLLQQRLLAFLKQDHSSDYLELLYNSDAATLRTFLHDEILACCERFANKSILIILDALDQLSGAQTVQHLNWLPPKFTQNCRCIVSSSGHPPTVSRIQEHKHFSVSLGELQGDDAKQIIQSFLLRFNKQLDDDQLKLILNSKCSESPLWLYLVCEELRVYGDFRTLTNRIQSVTSSFEGMMDSILQRLINEDDSHCMEKALSLLACSVGVITSLDLQRMLGDVKLKEPLAALTWGHIKRSLTAYLRVTNYNDQITFVHGQIREVVYKSMIKTEPESWKWHALLADYIEYWSEDKTLKMEALPYHLQCAQLRQRIVHFVREVPESARIPSFKRSSLMSHCRCRNLADAIISGVVPVLICTFCRHQRARFFPYGFHSNEDMCVVCGNQVVGGPFSTGANICHFHGVHQSVGLTKCILCNNMYDKKMMINGKLCQHCGFGNDGKRCACLEDHL